MLYDAIAPTPKQNGISLISENSREKEPVVNDGENPEVGASLATWKIQPLHHYLFAGHAYCLKHDHIWNHRWFLYQWLRKAD
jgi:hypothetical protein